MLSNEQIEQNKQTFIELINSIEREFNKERLISWLEKEDRIRALNQQHLLF